jgi:hypothetical protein
MRPVEGVRIMRLAARDQARGQKFRQSRYNKPGPHGRSRPCHLLGGDRIRVGVSCRDSFGLWLLGRFLHASRRSHQRRQPASPNHQLLGGLGHRFVSPIVLIEKSRII